MNLRVIIPNDWIVLFNEKAEEITPPLNEQE